MTSLISSLCLLLLPILAIASISEHAEVCSFIFRWWLSIWKIRFCMACTFPEEMKRRILHRKELICFQSLPKFPSPTRPRVAIIGAGMAGLSTARRWVWPMIFDLWPTWSLIFHCRLNELNIGSVDIYEALDRIGGRINSVPYCECLELSLVEESCNCWVYDHCCLRDSRNSGHSVAFELSSLISTVYRHFSLKILKRSFFPLSFYDWAIFRSNMIVLHQIIIRSKFGFEVLIFYSESHVLFCESLLWVSTQIGSILSLSCSDFSSNLRYRMRAQCGDTRRGRSDKRVQQTVRIIPPENEW